MHMLKFPRGRQAPSSASILPTIPLALGTEPFSKMISRNNYRGDEQRALFKFAENKSHESSASC